MSLCRFLFLPPFFYKAFFVELGPMRSEVLVVGEEVLFSFDELGFVEPEVVEALLDDLDLLHIELEGRSPDFLCDDALDAVDERAWNHKSKLIHFWSIDPHQSPQQIEQFVVVEMGEVLTVKLMERELGHQAHHIVDGEGLQQTDGLVDGETLKVAVKGLGADVMVMVMAMVMVMVTTITITAIMMNLQNVGRHPRHHGEHAVAPHIEWVLAQNVPLQTKQQLLQPLVAVHRFRVFCHGMDQSVDDVHVASLDEMASDLVCSHRE